MNDLDLKTRHIPRLFTDRHAKLMYGLVRWLQPEICVEVGAWKGFCTVHIAQALEDNRKGELYCIDDYTLGGSSASDIHNNLNSAGLAHRVHLTQGKSQEVQWPGRVDFAFVDGDHSFEGCLSDCNMAIEKGARCVCIHDTVEWWGPRDYLDAFREKGEGWDVLEANHDSGFAVLLKREPKGEPMYSQAKYPTGQV